MFRKFVICTFALVFVALCGLTDAAQQKDKKDKKRRTGTVIGELKSRTPTKNKKNVTIEVLAAGEEKARSYRVMYDPKVKGPNQKILEAVKAAKIGSRVQLDWIEGEGYNITAFRVLTKKDEKDKKKE